MKKLKAHKVEIQQKLIDIFKQLDGFKIGNEYFEVKKRNKLWATSEDEDNLAVIRHGKVDFSNPSSIINDREPEIILDFDDPDYAVVTITGFEEKEPHFNHIRIYNPRQKYIRYSTAVEVEMKKFGTITIKRLSYVQKGGQAEKEKVIKEKNIVLFTIE